MQAKEEKMNRFGLGGPALILACLAIFVALTGGAIAAQVVPMAKHAVTADTATNAKKLGGKTPAQIKASLRGAQGPQGPAGQAGPAGPTGSAGPQGAQGPSGPEGPQGPQGPKGDVGAGLEIIGTVAKEGDLPAAGETGDAYLIAGDLFVWTGSAWTNAGPVQGPQGETGPQGPAGPQGLQGEAGTAAVSVHTDDFSLTALNTPGDQGLLTASCDAGQKAVGGGYSSNGSVFNADTFPTASGDGWSIYLFNDGAEAVEGTVYAVCLG
jgi:hypothetical protein